jgi:stage V sporulation protein R
MTREFNVKKLSEAKLREKYIKRINENPDSLPEDFDINQFPLEPNYNILEFVRDHSRNLEHWEKDLLTIVSDEGSYFIPQAMTKIMNEGWASFWHYKILHELDLPQAYHMSFLKLHNQVIRPIVGRLNPYHLGFTIFMWIEKNLGLDHCFIARESHNDESFIRKYLNEEICRDLNLFTYSKKRTEWSIDDISDDDGWKDVRNELVKNVGLGSLPKIFIKKVEKNHTLILGHDHDGRDLDLNYANKVCEHIVDLWGDDVKLFTIIEEELFEI